MLGNNFFDYYYSSQSEDDFGGEEGIEVLDTVKDDQSIGVF